MADKKPKLTIEESDDREAAGPGREATDERSADGAVGVSAGERMGGAAGETAGDSVGGSSEERENPFGNVVGAASGWLSGNFPGHENAVFGGLCGLVVAILVFVIGFWQAIFLAICVTAGVAIGQYVDGNPTVVRFVRRFFGESN